MNSRINVGFFSTEKKTNLKKERGTVKPLEAENFTKEIRF